MYHPVTVPAGLILVGRVPRLPAPGGIENGDGAVLAPQDTVKHIVRVNVTSRDHPRRIDADRVGAYGAKIDQ